MYKNCSHKVKVNEQEQVQEATAEANQVHRQQQQEDNAADDQVYWQWQQQQQQGAMTAVGG